MSHIQRLIASLLERSDPACPAAQSHDSHFARYCRFARRGRGRSTRDGQRGLPHPSPFRRAAPWSTKWRRLDQAVRPAAEIDGNREAVSRELGEQYGAVFSAHLQMLRDPALRSELESMIRERHYSPEYAVSRALRRYAKVFQAIESSYLAERANDIYDIEKRLLRNLLGRNREELAQLISPVIVLAHNLTPSETANLNRAFVRGFATEIGGPGSHTAIVAEGLEIPAVVGTGEFLDRRFRRRPGHHRRRSRPGDPAAGRRDDRPLSARGRAKHQPRQRDLETLRELPAETADGVRVELFGNIEFPSEVTHCVDRGADGIGLYRTEFLYLGSDSEPRRGSTLRGLCRSRGRDEGATRRHPHLRPGSRQGLARRGNYAESDLGPAQHSAVAQESAAVSHPVAGRAAGQRHWETCG